MEQPTSVKEKTVLFMEIFLLSLTSDSQFIAPGTQSHSAQRAATNTPGCVQRVIYLPVGKCEEVDRCRRKRQPPSWNDSGLAKTIKYRSPSTQSAPTLKYPEQMLTAFSAFHISDQQAVTRDDVDVRARAW
jgi:hypothetical protein